MIDAPVLTVRQHTLVRSALHVVERAAGQVAKRFDRFVKAEDLLAVGTFELYEAARAFDESYNHTFADYAIRRVRCAMIKAVDVEMFHDRVRRSVDIATDTFWAYLTDREYDASKHDEHDARRRLQSIANGMLGAAFTAGVEEAQRSTTETEAAEQEEYHVAVSALRAALALLSDPERRILAALYRDLMDSREASTAMSIPYSSFRRRHAAALERLRKELMAQGVKRAPRPRFVPDPGSLLGLPRGAPGNDGEPPR